MRKAEKLVYKQSKSAIFGKFYNLLLRVVFSCDIPVSVKVGKEFFLPHNGLGVVIHSKAVIGDRVSVYQNATIGGNAKIENNIIVNSGAPVIEDDVAIFAGARVLGPIRIGKNSYIGANAIVTKDVPPDSVVYGYNQIKKRTTRYNLGREKNEK